MAKASLTLPDGTIVHVEGSPEEIQKIISLHRHIDEVSKTPKEVNTKNRKTKINIPEDSALDLMQVVNQIKNCDEAEQIEQNILDRNSQVDRILLPLFIIKKYMGERQVMTSGDISKVLGDLGINMFTPNVANTLSGSASKYVIGDKVRKRGQPVKYKISRRGENYLSSVINNKVDG